MVLADRQRWGRAVCQARAGEHELCRGRLRTKRLEDLQGTAAVDVEVPAGILHAPNGARSA